jgi:tetratricopeptide (TPR) repeat protein
LAGLVAGLIVPLVAAVRTRKEPLAALLFGAYVAFVIHAGADWDFELPGVSLAGLFCGAALVVAARDEPGPQRLRGVVRTTGMVLAVGLTGFALWALIGNSALSASEDARADHNWTKAEDQARKARDLMPWSPEPWEALGFAQAARGDARAAAASFRRAIERDPGDWTLWFDLAAVAKGREREHALTEARRLNPLSPELEELSSRFR